MNIYKLRSSASTPEFKQEKKVPSTIICATQYPKPEVDSSVSSQVSEHASDYQNITPSPTITPLWLQPYVYQCVSKNYYDIIDGSDSDSGESNDEIQEISDFLPDPYSEVRLGNYFIFDSTTQKLMQKPSDYVTEDFLQQQIIVCRCTWCGKSFDTKLHRDILTCNRCTSRQNLGYVPDIVPIMPVPDVCDDLDFSLYRKQSLRSDYRRKHHLDTPFYRWKRRRRKVSHNFIPRQIHKDLDPRFGKKRKRKKESRRRIKPQMGVVSNIPQPLPPSDHRIDDDDLYLPSSEWYIPTTDRTIVTPGCRKTRPMPWEKKELTPSEIAERAVDAENARQSFLAPASDVLHMSQKYAKPGTVLPVIREETGDLCGDKSTSSECGSSSSSLPSSSSSESCSSSSSSTSSGYTADNESSSTGESSSSRSSSIESSQESASNNNENTQSSNHKKDPVSAIPAEIPIPAIDEIPIEFDFRSPSTWKHFFTVAYSYCLLNPLENISQLCKNSLVYMASLTRCDKFVAGFSSFEEYFPGYHYESETTIGELACYMYSLYTDWQRFVKTEEFEKCRKMFVRSFYFIATFAKDSTDKQFRIRILHAAESCVRDSNSLFDLLVNTIWVMAQCYTAKQSDDWSFIFSETRLQRLEKRMSELGAKFESALNGHYTAQFPNQDSLREHAGDIVTECSQALIHVPSGSRRELFLRRYKGLTEQYNAFKERCVDANVRIQPFVIEMVGLAGQGKTTFMMRLLNYLNRVCNINASQSQTAIYDPTDQFEGNIREDTKIVFFDDACNKKLQSSDTPLCQVLSRLVNRNKMPIKKAEAHEKSRSHHNALLIGICENEMGKDFHAHMSIDPGSVGRRLGYRTRFKLDKEFLSPLGMLDSEKVIAKHGDDLFPDIYTFTIEVAILKPNEKKVTEFEFVEIWEGRMKGYLDVMANKCRKHLTLEQWNVDHSCGDKIELCPVITCDSPRYVCNHEKRPEVKVVTPHELKLTAPSNAPFKKKDLRFYLLEWFLKGKYSVDFLRSFLVDEMLVSVISAMIEGFTMFVKEEGRFIIYNLLPSPLENTPIAEKLLSYLFDDYLSLYRTVVLSVKYFLALLPAPIVFVFWCLPRTGFSQEYALIIARDLVVLLYSFYLYSINVLSKHHLYYSLEFIKWIFTFEYVQKIFGPNIEKDKWLEMTWWDYLKVIIKHIYSPKKWISTKIKMVKKFLLCSLFAFIYCFRMIKGKISSVESVITIALFYVLYTWGNISIQKISYEISDVSYKIKTEVFPSNVRDRTLPAMYLSAFGMLCIPYIWDELKMCKILLNQDAQGAIMSAPEADLKAHRDYARAQRAAAFSREMQINIDVNRTAEESKDRIKNSLVDVHYIKDGKPDKRTCGLYVMNMKLLIPEHVNLGKYDAIKIIAHQGLEDYTNIFPIESIPYVSIPGKDLIMLKVQQYTARDIVSCFPTEVCLSGKVICDKISFGADGNTSEACLVRAEPNCTNNALGQGKGPFFPGLHVSDVKNQPGDCMSMYVAARKVAAIVGLHLGGDGELGVAVQVTQKELKEASRLLNEITNSQGPSEIGKSKHLIREELAHTIPEKCFLTRPEAVVPCLPLAYVEKRANPKTCVRPTLISSHVKNCFELKEYSIDRYEKPMLRGPDGKTKDHAYSRSAKKIMKGCVGLPMSDMDWAVKDLSNVYFRLVEKCKKSSMYIPSPVSLDAVINGIHMNPYFKGVKRDTSGGFGFSGRKDKYMIQDENGNYSMNEDVMAAYNEIKEFYLDDKRSGTIFAGNLKDEPVLCDIVDGVYVPSEKVRVFYASQIPFQLLVMQYFGPVIQCLRLHPIEAESAVGIAPQTKEWDTMKRYCHSKGVERGFLVDYSGYDLSLCEQIMNNSIEIYIEMAKRMEYTAEDIRIMRGIKKDIVNPVLLYDNIVMLSNSVNPSGTFLTIHVNNTCTQLIQRCCFHSQCPELSYDEFQMHVAMSNTGDDNYGSVSERAKAFNMVSFRDYCAKYNITVTSATKGNVQQEFMHLVDDSDICPYLKRVDRIDEDLLNDEGEPLIRGCLLFTSLTKSATLTTSSLDDKEHTHSLVQNQLCELFIHGREKYERCGKALVDIAAKVGVPVEFLSYDERLKIFLQDPDSPINAVVAEHISPVDYRYENEVLVSTRPEGSILSPPMDEG